MNTSKASSRYHELYPLRTPFLDTTIECASLSIPSLQPPIGHGAGQRLPTPYQSLAANGVRNLASKLLMTLLPTSPFFRMVIDDFSAEKLTQSKNNKGKLEQALNKYERAVMTKINVNIRNATFEAFKYLIVSGNGLLYRDKKRQMKFYRLDRYVVRRDSMGNLIELLIHESVDIEALPESVREIIRGKMNASPGGSIKKEVDLYTWAILKDDKWHIHQEAMDEILPESKSVVAAAKFPFIVLRWARAGGEDYGRGLVEEFLGDIKSLEGLMKSVVEGTAANSKVIVAVNPNGVTDADDVSKAENLDVIDGTAEDVTTIQAGSSARFDAAFNTMQILERRLSMAFLLNSAIQRNGERVTAEEIRYMANEIEDALGGVYSLLAEEYQLPLVNMVIEQEASSGALPKLPRQVVNPTIITGLDALGRGHDLNKLRVFGSIAMESAQLPMEVNKSEYLSRSAASLGVSTDGLIYTPEEVAAFRQQEQLNELARTAAPNIVNQVGNAAAAQG